MSTFKNAPISRHEALAPLSRDHYTGDKGDPDAGRTRTGRP